LMLRTLSMLKSTVNVIIRTAGDITAYVDLKVAYEAAVDVAFRAVVDVGVTDVHGSWQSVP